jgi:hypothetical protein
MEKIEPICKAEVDIYMCRIQGALLEGDTERVKKIQSEIRERLNELKKAGFK